MKVSIGTNPDPRAVRQAGKLRQALSSQGVDITFVADQGSGADLLLGHAVDMEALPSGHKVMACLKREPHREVLLALSEATHLENFSRRLRIGVTSARAAGLLAHFAPQADIVMLSDQDIREAQAGLQAGLWDGLLVPMSLAIALELEALIVQRLNPMAFLPSPGEGVWLLTGPEECPPLAALHHAPTLAAWTCERAFVEALPQTAVPMGLATVQQGHITFAAGLVFAQGQAPCYHTATRVQEEAEALGQAIAQGLFAMV